MLYPKLNRDFFYEVSNNVIVFCILRLIQRGDEIIVENILVQTYLARIS